VGRGRVGDCSNKLGEERMGKSGRVGNIGNTFNTFTSLSVGKVVVEGEEVHVDVEVEVEVDIVLVGRGLTGAGVGEGVEAGLVGVGLSFCAVITFDSA
jgi:hypothetical protein